MHSARPPPSALPRFIRWGRTVLLLGGFGAALVAQQQSREYDLKAVFLYNFASFVEWPKAARPPAGQPVVIGILGRDPFGAVLDNVVAGEILDGHPLVVRRYATPEAAAECHILYISASETKRLPQILETLRGKPVLTVADMPRFAESDAIITFSTGTRVQLHINTAAAQKAGLTISAKLLRVATIVGSASSP